jgi:hypothetical protein
MNSAAVSLRSFGQRQIVDSDSADRFCVNSFRRPRQRAEFSSTHHICILNFTGRQMAGRGSHFALAATENKSLKELRRMGK